MRFDLAPSTRGRKSTTASGISITLRGQSGLMGWSLGYWESPPRRRVCPLNSQERCKVSSDASGPLCVFVQTHPEVGSCIEHVAEGCRIHCRNQPVATKGRSNQGDARIHFAWSHPRDNPDHFSSGNGDRSETQRIVERAMRRPPRSADIANRPQHLGVQTLFSCVTWPVAYHTRNNRPSECHRTTCESLR